MEKVGVILADSNELIRIGLRTILTQHANAEIVGEAMDASELKEQVDSFDPSVVMIDYTSDGFTIDIIPEILKDHPDTAFVALTFEQSASTVVSALKSGVRSYIKKDCDLQEIIDSVVETGKGNKFFCGKILDTIREEGIDVEDIHFDALDCSPVSLSDRELEIIQHIAEGYTNAQIAEKLFLSNHTVNTHRKNIMGKLGVNNTAGIVMYAVKTGLVSPNKYLFAGQS